MHVRTFSRSVIFAAAVATLAACNSSTGPRFNPFDPDRAQADAEAMITAFDSPTLEQFMAASGYIDVGAGAMNAAVRSARHTVAMGGRVTSEQQRALAVMLSDAVIGDPSIAAAAVVPQEVRGTTFVFDAQEQMYVSSERTGAPANGVRYVLYGLDGSWQINPADEVGYIELQDLAPAGANSFGVRLRVVSGSTTYLDYTIGGVASQSSATLDVTGFVTNGVTRVDYATHLALVHSQSGTSADVEWQFSVPSRQFSVLGAISNFGGSSIGQVELIINSNRSQVRYLFQSGETLNGSIYVNGSLFATVTETGESLVITGANGQQLTEAERDVLESLLFMGIESFFWSFVLLSPVGWAIPL